MQNANKLQACDVNQMQDIFEKGNKVLCSLKIILDEPMQQNRGNVDATIHRFKININIFIKLLQKILILKGVDVVYPKDVLKKAYAGNLISDEAIWITMIDDRNMSSHTYNESFADEMYERIKTYYPVLANTFTALNMEFNK